MQSIATHREDSRTRQRLQCDTLQFSQKERRYYYYYYYLQVLIASDRCYHGDLGRPDVFEVGYGDGENDEE